MFNPFAHVCHQIKGCKETTLLNASCKLLPSLQLLFVFQKSNVCWFLKSLPPIDAYKIKVANVHQLWKHRISSLKACAIQTLLVFMHDNL